jgi:ABC-type polysaccharide/polyol phosphate export permease
MSSLALSGIALVLAAFAKNVQAAQPIAIILGLALMFLGELWFPLPATSPLLRPIFRAIPSVFVTHGLRTVLVEGAGFGRVAGDLSALLLLAAVSLVLAMAGFRRIQES